MSRASGLGARGREAAGGDIGWVGGWGGGTQPCSVHHLRRVAPPTSSSPSNHSRVVQSRSAFKHLPSSFHTYELRTHQHQEAKLFANREDGACMRIRLNNTIAHSSFPRPLIHSFARSLVRSFAHPLVRSFARALVLSCSRALVHSSRSLAKFTVGNQGFNPDSLGEDEKCMSEGGDVDCTGETVTIFGHRFRSQDVSRVIVGCESAISVRRSDTTYSSLTQPSRNLNQPHSTSLNPAQPRSTSTPLDPTQPRSTPLDLTQTFPHSAHVLLCGAHTLTCHQQQNTPGS